MSPTDAVQTSRPRGFFLSLEPATLLMALLFGVVALLVLTPLFLMLLNSFQLGRPGEPIVDGLEGWRQAFHDPSMLSALWNTVSLAVTRQAIALVIGVMLAWLIARTDLPWKNGLEFTFWISFFLPSLPVALGWILLLDDKFGLLNRWLQALPFINNAVFNV